MSQNPIQLLEYYLCKFITKTETVVYDLSTLTEEMALKIAKSVMYIEKYCNLALKRPLEEDSGLDIHILLELINEPWTSSKNSLLSASKELQNNQKPESLHTLLKEWASASRSEKELFFEDLKNLAEDLFIRA